MLGEYTLLFFPFILVDMMPLKTMHYKTKFIGRNFDCIEFNFLKSFLMVTAEFFNGRLVLSTNFLSCSLEICTKTDLLLFFDR